MAEVSYFFESDVNFSDEHVRNDIEYLSASSITLSSLFTEDLQIINNTIHISSTYEGDIGSTESYYGPLGCRDCQIQGSYNGIFYTLCEHCADLPDLLDCDSEYDLIEAQYINHDNINNDYINNINNNDYLNGLIRDFTIQYNNMHPHLISMQINYQHVQSDSNTTFECPICYDVKHTCASMTFQCSHQFCGDCSCAFLRVNHSCPICRESVGRINL
jgi:hypothetical protein